MIRKISVGKDNPCFVDVNGKIHTEGEFASIELGQFKAVDIAFGHNRLFIIDRNNDLSLVSNNLCKQGIFKIGDIKAKKIFIGHEHEFIVDLQNNVYAHGSNNKGQLGLGQGHTCYALPLTLTNHKFKRMHCGYFSTFIIKDNGDVYAFGDNRCGLLGLGHRYIEEIPRLLDIKFKSIKSGILHSLGLTYDNEVFACGSNSDKIFF